MEHLHTPIGESEESMDSNSMFGSDTEVSTDEDEVQMNCIFMREAKSEGGFDSDIISISDFKSQMEKMLSPKMTEYETCLEIQSKIKRKREEINQIKSELDSESGSRKKLNDKISSGLKELNDLKGELNKATSPDLMYSKLREEKLAIYLKSFFPEFFANRNLKNARKAFIEDTME